MKTTIRMAAIVVAAVLLLVLTPTRGVGGDCYARARTYYSPSYSYSYAPTYTPAYYTPPCYETKLKTVAYPTSPDYYSSVSDYYRDKLLVDAIAGKTASVLKEQKAQEEKDNEFRALKEEVLQLRQRLLMPQAYAPQLPLYQPPVQQTAPYQQPVPQAAPPQQPPPQKQEAPRQMPKAASVHPVPPKLQAIVQQSCIRCHGETFAKTGDGIDLRDLAAVPDAVRRAAAQAVEDGTMPKGGKNLGDAEYQEFRVWSTGRRATTQAQK